MMASIPKISMIAVALALTLSGCSKKATDETSTEDDLAIAEAGQQVGDAMASVDESGGGGGNFAQTMKAEAKFFARVAPGSVVSPSPLQSLLFPTATAAACSTVAYGACTSGVTNRIFSGCTVGSAEFTGSVTLTYTDGPTSNANAGCSLIDDGDAVFRVPNYTVSGLRSAELTVTKSGSFGQYITRLLAGVHVYRLDNDGINRKFTLAGQMILDSTTTITQNDSSVPMTINGTARSGRTLTGGKLTVTNNLNSKSCSFEPSAVTWGASCNCATSGSWAGTCSDGASSNIQITGCGTADVTIGEKTESITFDRCYN